MKNWSISGKKILTPDDDLNKTNILIEDGKIEKLSVSEIDSDISVEIPHGIITPGLINSHDHLLGTYFPKVGKGPYENWLPWDNDLKSSPVYQERQQIENRDLYYLGAYRNLVSGVTMVSDHIPHFVGDPYYDELPMKAVKDFSMAHSVASFSLAWGDDISVEYSRAVKEDLPFITHIAEGFDAETVNDLKTIEKKGGLGNHSVFVHGIAFSESDMSLIKERGASVVWCADSNIFMFNETTDIKMLLDMGINVAIGTDSPMSGGVHLLHEMKYDKALYKEIYGDELPDEVIFRMVTANAAKALRQKKAGHIKTGYLADLVVFRDQGDASYSSIVNAELKDVLLVIIDGKPVYGDEEFDELFSVLDVEFQYITIDGVSKIIIGDLKGLLRRISSAVGFKKTFPFLPVDFEL